MKLFSECLISSYTQARASQGKRIGSWDDEGIL